MKCFANQLPLLKQISLSDARDALCMYKTVFGILCFEIQAWLH